MPTYEFCVFGHTDESTNFAFVTAAKAAQNEGWEIIGVTKQRDTVFIYCRRPKRAEEEIDF